MFRTTSIRSAAAALILLSLLLSPTLGALAASSQDPAQDDDGGFPGLPVGHVPEVEIPWNRLYDYSEIHGHFDRLVEAFPELLQMQEIGKSTESRELRVYVLNNPQTGTHESKPAMWIDGNVHGNEVQAAETVLYTAWYLLENYGHNASITELVDRAAFYLLPMVNPDGRAHWFQEAHSASSSRTGYQPVDNDRDGVADEDPANDLNGDGHITQMRKYVPGEGTHRIDPDDPRVMVRVPANDDGLRGDWILLGSEGIDDDGDGRLNEDGLGGYDMNRAWPSMWQPEHVQRGAGPYPLYWPETRAISSFLLTHPNVAAAQSFHNAGGMILRGPGVAAYGSYPAADVRVYDELGRDGELMLPFYRYMILWKDLYSVFGGFVTWTYESLGIVSFTNELWTRSRSFPDSSRDTGGDRHWFDDHLLMGAGFLDWEPYNHPLYGRIEIGGFRKDVGRVPPTFLIEEMVHRNAMFNLRHAQAMPEVLIEDPQITDLGGDLKAIDVIFRNNGLIPTRTAMANDKRIGTPDLFTLEAGQGLQVLAGGFRSDRFRPSRIELAEKHPARLVREQGIGSRGEVRVRWIVRGRGRATVAWSGQKGKDVATRIDL